ncbi:UNVERIFIED_CONTAM: Retrovirus-related Pol polyprotein from transposon RE1 [Sesamum latifolium]|uniref:Retrovirus-related Pol polyprotein from transposon RE1 n=1 Tax=Sesamum latifolium TaxID=2727402 RepID=A0AAW2VWZ3_9LAMI
MSISFPTPSLSPVLLLFFALGFDPMDAAVLSPAPPMHSASSLPSSPTTTQSLPIPAPAPTSTSSPTLQPSSSALNPPLCKTTRTITKPQRLNDFVCHTTSCVPTVHLTLAYACFVASLSTLREPRTYKQATQHQEWVDAMQQEILALEKIHTWDVTPLPPGKHPIGCKWVFKLKMRDDGSVESCKARFVAKGFSQIEGVDYAECFSPVAKAVTVRLFLAISSAFGWPLHQLDINNAFLQGFIDDEVYMQPPEGYLVQSGHVCKLRKSLYSLKQASRQWNQELTSKLLSFGFSQSGHDHCLFVKGAAATAFIALKKAMLFLPVLQLPNFSQPFDVMMDASQVAVGPVLSQQRHPVAFFSKKMSPKMQASSTYEREMFAITEAVRKWHQYLLVVDFIYIQIRRV